MKNYLKFKLYTALISPLFFVAALIFNIVCPVYYFYVKNFFGGQGTTDLYNLFFIIPVISSVLIPVLSLNSRTNSFEAYIPLCNYKKIIDRILSIFIQYTIIILPQIFLPCCVNLFGSVDAGIAFAGFFMLLLFALASSALCIFFEILTENFQLSLILNILALTVANGLNILLIYFEKFPFITALTKTVSLQWHFDSAGKGILDTRDIVYFVALTFIFTIAAYLTNEKRKGFIFTKNERVQLIFLVLIVVFGSLNAGRFYLRKDISKNHRISISKYTKNLINEAEDFIKITYFKSRTLDNLYPAARDIKDYLKELSQSKNVIFEEKDPSNEDDFENLKKYGISGREFQKFGKNKTEYVTVYSTIVLEYGGVWDVIPFILSANSLEYSLDVCISNLMGGKRHIVNVLCGNELKLEKDYSYVVPWLNSQGFICNKLELNTNIEEQLQYSKLLMIFGTDQLDEEKCEEIEAFLNKGGKLLAFANKYNADIENSWYITKSKSNTFIDLLEKHGFGFSESLVLDISCARITMQSDNDQNGKESLLSKSMNYPMWVEVMPQTYAKQGITLFWPNPLVPLSENVQPLCYSSYSSWQVEPDKNQNQNLFVTNPFQLEETKFDSPKSQNTVALTSESEGITVVPDQYFVHSLMLGYIGGKTGDYRNLDFVVNQLLRLNMEPELAALQEKSTLSVNNTLFKTPDIETFESAKNRTVFFMFIFVPLLIIGFWSYLLYWRKKHGKSISD